MNRLVPQEPLFAGGVSTRRRLWRRATAAIAAALIFSGAANAAEIRVMISGGLTAAYRELVPGFERSSGNKVLTAFGPSMGTTENAIPVRLSRGNLRTRPNYPTRSFALWSPRTPMRCDCSASVLLALALSQQMLISRTSRT